MALYRIQGYPDDKAQRIGEEIASLGKKFTPYDVVEKASNTSSSMNSFFEWDDSKAANEHRLNQARSLIQKIKIVVVDVHQDKTETRAFHNVEVVISNKLEHRYVPLREVKASPVLRDQVIQKAFDELKDWERKYRQYQDILGLEIFEAIEAIGEKIH